jgi:hypothetical protein
VEIDAMNVASKKSAGVEGSVVLSKATPWRCKYLDPRLLRDFKLLVQ